MKVLIVGGGLGGLTLAAFLEYSNIEYELIEKKEEWGAQGYALGLWSNSRHILGKLGLDDFFDTEGVYLSSYVIRDGNGRMLREYPFSDFYTNYGVALSMFSRPALHARLVAQVPAEKITMGRTIDSITQEKDAVRVQFSDGSTGSYDVVVGADGIHSQVRDLQLADNLEHFAGWRSWYARVPHEFARERAVEEYVAPGQFIAVFDMGDHALVDCMAPADHERWDAEQGRVERLRKTFTAIPAIAPRIFDTVRDQDLLPTDLAHVRVKRWSRGRVVLLGDAAHGCEPFAGLGGSMALEDAYVLAGELMQVSTSYPLSDAVRQYEMVRQERVGRVVKLTNRMRAWGLIRSQVLRTIASTIVPIIPAWLFMRDYHALFQEEI